MTMNYVPSCDLPQFVQFVGYISTGLWCGVKFGCGWFIANFSETQINNINYSIQNFVIFKQDQGYCMLYTKDY